MLSSVFDNPADHPTPPKPPPNQSPGKKKEIITKHDSTVCGRRNVKIVEKVCVMIVAVNLLTLLTLYSPEYQNTKKNPPVSSFIMMPSFKTLFYIVLCISSLETPHHFIEGEMKSYSPHHPHPPH